MLGLWELEYRRKLDMHLFINLGELKGMMKVIFKIIRTLLLKKSLRTTSCQVIGHLRGIMCPDAM